MLTANKILVITRQLNNHRPVPHYVSELPTPDAEVDDEEHFIKCFVEETLEKEKDKFIEKNPEFKEANWYTDVLHFRKF